MRPMRSMDSSLSDLGTLVYLTVVCAGTVKNSASSVCICVMYVCTESFL